MRKLCLFILGIVLLGITGCSRFADLPLPPPQLLARAPALGEAQMLDAPIRLIFDQAMDRRSVEAALTFEPPLTGKAQWPDKRTLVFQPATLLERGQQYRVTVAQTARNADGEPLVEPIRFDFSTLGFLNVTSVQPAPDMTDVALNSPVTVIFDRPVVPLKAIEDQKTLPAPLSFTPPVAGQGEWVNTFIYRFTPASGFLPSTRYTARVSGDLTDTIGALLGEDYVWEFSTPLPTVSCSPREGTRHVGTATPVRLTFSQPMQRASVEGAFALTVNQTPATGIFAWSGGEYPTQTETLVFTPTQTFPRSATVTVTLGLAQARYGDLGFAQGAWRFFTIGQPGLEGVHLQEFAGDLESANLFDILFSTPMSTTTVVERLHLYSPVIPTGTLEGVNLLWSNSNTYLQVNLIKAPGISYEIVLDPGALDEEGGLVDAGGRASVTTQDRAPYVLLNTDTRLGFYNAYSDTIVYAGYRNVSRLDLTLYQVPPITLIEQTDELGAAPVMRLWSIPVEPLRNKGYLTPITLLTEAGDALPPGIYELRIAAPEAPEIPVREDYNWNRRYRFVRARVNLMFKQGVYETLVWATDLATGAPVAQAPVSWYAYGAGSDVHLLDINSVTDADGLAVSQERARDQAAVMTGQPGSPDFAIATRQWSQGITPWDFDLASNYTRSDYRGYLYTDRPIYRPGQTVYFKGILRTDDDAHYTLPPEGKQVEVQITDPQRKLIYEKKLTLTQGAMYAELQLDAEAAVGTYILRMDDAQTTFRVIEYRKPEYQVMVETDAADYLAGDTLTVAADASYYFGGPVADAAVEWKVLSTGYTFQYQCPGACPRYSWSDDAAYAYAQTYGGNDRVIASQLSRTDALGRDTLQVPADISLERASRRFVLEATVTDINGQAVSSRALATVHQGEFYVGVAPRGRVVQAGETRAVDVIAVDWDSAPVAGTPLEITFLEHRWYSTRRQEEGGGFYWTWVVEDIPIYTTTVTTGADGKATVQVTPPTAGSYKIRAAGVDSRGAQVRSAAYLWVWGGDQAAWRQESHPRIDLIANQDEYRVGDVAEILIPSPYAGPVHALITIERGHIIETQVRVLHSNSELLQIPITDAHVPNIFVSVVLMQGSQQTPDGLASFKIGMIQLPVQVQEKQLHVTVVSDRDMTTGAYYRPRETVHYTITVTDAAGRPVAAELSLRVADLAVLSLADEAGPTMLEHFWSKRGLSIRTSSPLLLAMEKYTRDLVPGAKGGGGAGVDGLVRTNFMDTALWLPVLHTDEQGMAYASVELPDNLTTWRMQARAITPDMRVGQAELDILSTLDMLVRAVLPRFFIVGDQAEIATIVHNNTGQPQQADVAIQAEGLRLAGPTRERVSIPAKDKVKVTWAVTALPGAQVTVTMDARAGVLYDGRTDTLPVYRYTTPEVVATSGQLSEAGVRQELIYLPDAFDPDQGELRVQLNGALTASTRDALKYLEHYPYECVEQTVSRFLPNVLMQQAMKELGVARPELETALQTQVSVASQRLYAQQHADGGWGWWTTDESNGYLTAYALHGLLEAHHAGFTVEPAVIQRAAKYLREQLTMTWRYSWESNRLVYQVYVLSEYYQLLAPGAEFDMTSEASTLALKRTSLSQYGQALLAVTFINLSGNSQNPQAQQLLNLLKSQAVLSATGAHWEETSPDQWNMGTDARTTATVLWALSRGGDLDLSGNAARWLMKMRSGDGYWESTHTTAWALMGLVAYMRASGELQGDFDYAVYLNGKSVMEGTVNQETLNDTREVQVVIAKLLDDKANRLIIEREAPKGDQTGLGQLYYTAHLRYYLPVADVEALDRGITLIREYFPVTRPATDPHTAQVGDIVRVKLTLIASTNLHYVLVESPLPAGYEALDTSLKTTGMIGSDGLSRANLLRGYGWWRFNHTELRDEKVALFSTYLPRGVYEYTYLMRASLPGVYNTLPAMASQMYFPEVFGRSAGDVFTVGELTERVSAYPTSTPRPTATPSPTPTPTPVQSPTPTPGYPLYAVAQSLAGPVQQLWAAPDGRLWVATDAGLWRQAGSGWETLYPEPVARILGQDAAGRVWILLPHAAGIAVYDGAQWRAYGPAQGWLPPLDPAGLTEATPRPPRYGAWGRPVLDRAGNVWLTTGRDDLRRLDAQTGQWTSFSAADLGFAPVAATPGHLLTAAALDAFGNLWVGDCVAYGETLRGQGVRWFDSETWSGSNDTLEECIYAIDVDAQGQVWLGGRFALTQYSPAGQAFRQIPLPQTWYYQVVTELTLDDGGVPWITVAETDRQGRFTNATLYRRRGEAWEKMGVATLTAPLTRVPDGTVWQCQNGSITRDGEPVATLPDIAPDASCTVIGDAAGHVWVTDQMKVWQLITYP